MAILHTNGHLEAKDWEHTLKTPAYTQMKKKWKLWEQKEVKTLKSCIRSSKNGEMFSKIMEKCLANRGEMELGMGDF